MRVGVCVGVSVWRGRVCSFSVYVWVYGRMGECLCGCVGGWVGVLVCVRVFGCALLCHM